VDKFSGYVIASYVVTFVVLFGYLGWLWWRLRQEEGQRR
jgi:heme exporter protein CcmD